MTAQEAYDYEIKNNPELKNNFGCSIIIFILILIIILYENSK